MAGPLTGGGAGEAPPSAGGGQHICLVIKDLDVGKGGAERLFVELAAILAGLGYKVTCLYYGAALNRSQLRLDESIEVRNLASDDARTISPLMKSRRFRGLVLRLLRLGYGLPWVARLIWQATHGRFTEALRRYFSEVRPAAAISFLPPANTPVLVAAQGTPVRVVCTNHNVPAADYDDPSRWDPNPHDRRLRLSALDGAAAIHILAPSFATWFPQHLHEKISVIPNYVSPAILKSRVAGACDRLVLAAGRLAKVKEYATLARAWALIASRFPDWRVEVYGDGPLRGRLADEVDRLGIADTFRLCGYEPDIGAVYARASIFCHPARFEGFGLAVAEALALGVPVVAFSDCAGVNEFVVDHHNGLLVEREEGAAAIAAALSRLIVDEDLRRRLAADCPASVAAYDIATYTERWSALLQKVLRA